MAASVILKAEAKSLSMFRHFALRAISRSLINVQSRNLTTSSVNFAKKIQETTTDNVTVIEGIIHESDRKANLIPLDTRDDTGTCCVLCRLDLKIRHTDVLILSQFVRPDGCMLNRRVTGLCPLQQKTMSCLVAQAQKAGLMSNLTPHWSNKDPTKRADWKKFNRYFDPGLSGNVAKRYK